MAEHAHVTRDRASLIVSFRLTIWLLLRALNEFEFAFIRSHARAGYDILSGIDFPWPVGKIVLQHHERLDGSGYPQRLQGDEIIQEARIIAVADVVESMCSHRPYRPALGIKTTLEEIDHHRNTLYDSAVVDVCIALFEQKGFQRRGV